MELMQQRSASQESLKVLTRAEALQAEHVASLRVLAAQAVHQTFETRQRALVAKIEKAADQLAALNSEAVQLSDEFCRETDSQLDSVECMRIGSKISGFEFLEMWRDEQRFFQRLPVARK